MLFHTSEYSGKWSLKLTHFLLHSPQLTYKGVPEGREENKGMWRRDRGLHHRFRAAWTAWPETKRTGSHIPARGSNAAQGSNAAGAPSIPSGCRHGKTVRCGLWQQVQSCRGLGKEALKLEVSWIRNFCGFLFCSYWPKTKRFGSIWSQESLGLSVTFDSICRPLECVKKSFRRKRTENSLVGVILGSNFKRKGVIDLGWWTRIQCTDDESKNCAPETRVILLTSVTRLTLQRRKSYCNSAPEGCVSTRTLLVPALEVGKGKEFQYVPLF